MTRTEFDAEAHLDHMSAVLGLEVRPEWRAGVIANLDTAAKMASMVLQFPLDDEIEPAFAFEAGR